MRVEMPLPDSPESILENEISESEVWGTLDCLSVFSFIQLDLNISYWSFCSLHNRGGIHETLPSLDGRSCGLYR